MEAAVDATKEIALAVMATTISLVIIFVPIAFMTGYAKRYLNQFGWTMAFSIMVSMLVAFTLTPTLSARLLKRQERREAARAHGEEQSALVLERGYMSIFDWSLGHRWVIVLHLRGDFRLHVRGLPVHRPRLDAAGRPERTVRHHRTARRLLAGSAPKQRDHGVARKIENVPGVTAVDPATLRSTWSA